MLKKINKIPKDSYVSDKEMEEIIKDPDLTKEIKSGLTDIKLGNYKIIN